MNKLRDVLSNKKLVYTTLGIVLGIIILILVVFFLIKMIGKKITYSELENELYFATEKYLKDHDAYPTEEYPEMIVSSSDLVAEKYIKELSKLVKDSCSAEIEVLYKNDAYQIKPFLTCEHYESQPFFDKVLEDNPVTVESNGLYDLNEMLVFRGDKVNNYVKFNNMIWRIVKMDPDESIVYLILDNVKEANYGIWDDRYNTTEESKHGINDFSVSVISYTLDEIFEEKFDSAKSRMVPMDICISKRSLTENVNDGSVECSHIIEEKKFVSLLPVYDYLNASTDHRCSTVEDRACANYNYLVNQAGKWWTLTADGTNGNRVFGINYNGAINSDYADTKKYVRYIIAVDGTNIYQEGNGTINNPYMMK